MLILLNIKVVQAVRFPYKVILFTVSFAVDSL